MHRIHFFPHLAQYHVNEEISTQRKLSTSYQLPTNFLSASLASKLACIEVTDNPLKLNSITPSTHHTGSSSFLVCNSNMYAWLYVVVVGLQLTGKCLAGPLPYGETPGMNSVCGSHPSYSVDSQKDLSGDPITGDFSCGDESESESSSSFPPPFYSIADSS